MLHKTKGIALHTVKFSETSIIVKIYTELFGLQSYLIRGIRKQRSKIKPGLFQPLTILDLSVYHKETGKLQSIKDVNILYPYQTLPFDIMKSSIALYMNELLYKSVKQEEPDPGLFDFLFRTCIELDSLSAGFRMFPLLFTVRLTKFLGFHPRSEDSQGKNVFNMKEGVFQENTPDHKYYFGPPLSGLLKKMIILQDTSSTSGSFPEEDPPGSQASRNRLLDEMLLYYKLHLPGFSEVHSHKILHIVLS
jgi:DNA repair protein RecO (recombination protein O)